MTQRTAFVLIVLAGLIVSPAATALIKVQTPVSKMFDSSVSVVAGKVTKVNVDSGVVEASASTLKGDGLGESIKIKLESLPEVLKGVKEGSPVVLFLGRRTASNALSFADTWLLP